MDDVARLTGIIIWRHATVATLLRLSAGRRKGLAEIFGNRFGLYDVGVFHHPSLDESLCFAPLRIKRSPGRKGGGARFFGGVANANVKVDIRPR